MTIRRQLPGSSGNTDWYIGDIDQTNNQIATLADIPNNPANTTVAASFDTDNEMLTITVNGQTAATLIPIDQEVMANPETTPDTSFLRSIEIDGVPYLIDRVQTVDVAYTDNTRVLTVTVDGVQGTVTLPEGMGGTTVTANPEGTDGDPLTRISIAGTNYNITGSGGGTTVVANPDTTATDPTITSITIGTQDYRFPETENELPPLERAINLVQQGYNNRRVTRDTRGLVQSAVINYDNSMTINEMVVRDTRGLTLNVRYSGDQIEVLGGMGFELEHRFVRDARGLTTTDFWAFIRVVLLNLTLTNNGTITEFGDVVNEVFLTDNGTIVDYAPNIVITDNGTIVEFT